MSFSISQYLKQYHGRSLVTSETYILEESTCQGRENIGGFHDLFVNNVTLLVYITYENLGMKVPGKIKLTNSAFS